MMHVGGGEAWIGGAGPSNQDTYSNTPKSPISLDPSLQTFEMITSGPSPSPAVGSISIAPHALYSAGNGSGN